VQSKPIEKVTHEEWSRHTVWKILPESNKRDETWVKPVKRCPIKSLNGHLVATSLTLANGQSILGILGNLHPENLELSAHFLTLSVVSEQGGIFHLARYFDPDYDSCGPSALAKFLGLGITEVFPLKYRVASPVVQGVEAIASTIPATPEKMLTRAEIIALAVP